MRIIFLLEYLPFNPQFYWLVLYFYDVFVFQAVQEKLDEAASPSSYNVTACCVDAGLNQHCLPLCSYDASITDIKTLAGVCGGQLSTLIRCGAGGRNHTSCCSRRGVPSSCLPICSGVILGSLMSTASACIPFIGNIVQCFEEGILFP